MSALCTLVVGRIYFACGTESALQLALAVCDSNWLQVRVSND